MRGVLETFLEKLNPPEKLARRRSPRETCDTTGKTRPLADIALPVFGDALSCHVRLQESHRQLWHSQSGVLAGRRRQLPPRLGLRAPLCPPLLLPRDHSAQWRFKAPPDLKGTNTPRLSANRRRRSRRTNVPPSAATNFMPSLCPPQAMTALRDSVVGTAPILNGLWPRSSWVKTQILLSMATARE